MACLLVALLAMGIHMVGLPDALMFALPVSGWLMSRRYRVSCAATACPSMPARAGSVLRAAHIPPDPAD
jgi:hypothetical protein